MGRVKPVLGLIGMLIGAGVISLGFIDWNTATTNQTRINNIENIQNADARLINLFYFSTQIIIKEIRIVIKKDKR